MQILNENKIASLLKNFIEDGEAITDNPEITQALLVHKNNLTVEDVAGGYASKISGKNLANWIKPLHFAHNLNQAIDALSDLERLLAEQRSIILVEMQLNYFDKVLADSNDALQKQQELKSTLELEKEMSLLQLKTTQKMADLCEYCKAVDIGGKLLYGFETTTIIDNQDEQFLVNMRTWLRGVLLNYRETEKQNREMILPVSLRYMVNEPDFLVDYWSSMDETNAIRLDETTGLTDMQLAFNLANSSLSGKFGFARIKRVGVKIIDKVDRDTTTSTAKKTPNIWNVTLESLGDGFKLGSSGNSPKQHIYDLEFANVLGSASEIVWGSNASIINVNPDRAWNIIINNNHKYYDMKNQILDIIVYFHFDYLEKNF